MVQRRTTRFRSGPANVLFASRSGDLKSPTQKTAVSNRCSLRRYTSSSAVGSAGGFTRMAR
jgi:hypothetical protein